LTRNFFLLDHLRADSIFNFISIIKAHHASQTSGRCMTSTCISTLGHAELRPHKLAITSFHVQCGLQFKRFPRTSIN